MDVLEEVLEKEFPAIESARLTISLLLLMDGDSAVACFGRSPCPDDCGPSIAGAPVLNLYEPESVFKSSGGN